MTLQLLFVIYSYTFISGVYSAGSASGCDRSLTYFAQSGRAATLHVSSDTKFVSSVLYRGVKEKLLLRAYTETDLIIQDKDRLVVNILDERNVDIIIPDIKMTEAGIYTVTLDEVIMHCWEIFVLDIITPQGTEIFNEYEPAYFSIRQEHVNPNITLSTTWLYDGLNVSQTSKFLEVDGQILMLSLTRNMNGKLVTYRIVDDTGHTYDITRKLHVTYDKSFIIAVSILGAIQCITILVLSVCVVILYKKLRQDNNYLTCIYDKPSKRPGENEHKYDNTPAQDNCDKTIDVIHESDNSGYLEPDDFSIPS